MISRALIYFNALLIYYVGVIAMDWLETAVQISVIAGFIGGIISYLINTIVLRPLESTLTRLQVIVDKLSEQLSRTEERWHDIDKKVSEVDQRARSAHRRLDEHLKLYHEHGGVYDERVEHR